MLMTEVEPVNPSATVSCLAQVIKVSTRSLSWTKKGLFFLLMVIAISVAQPSFAQTLDVANDKEVSDFLEQIEAQNRTRSIFDVNTRREIGVVSFDAEYSVVKRVGDWRIIEFKQPSVEVWVSSDYVSVSGGRVTVNASRLNMRILPSLDAPVLGQLNRGYISTLLGRSNGFVNVQAPRDFRVAIFDGKDINQAESGSWAYSDEDIAPPRNTKETRSSKRDYLPSVLAPTVEENANQASTERLHVIAPGDAISLQVFGEKDLSVTNVRVPQSGQVSLPLIGSILVSGRTIPEIEASVAELLGQGYVKNPRLSVTIFSYRPIFIRGAVAQTGSFPFSEGLTIGKALALAGGSKKSAKNNGVSVLRDGQVIENDLSIDSLVEVRSGDVISVEEEFGVQENDATYIYLHGEVASPGEYQFRRNLTVEKAVVLAGGFTLRGSRRKISVTRYADSEKGGEPVKLKKVELYTPIKPGDIINVGATWF